MDEKNEAVQGISDRRKAAFLRYMAILFALAFILVLLSMILQSNSSKATISELNETSRSAMENALQLQDENRSLHEQNDTLGEELAQTKELLAQKDAELAQAQQAQTELEAVRQELETLKKNEKQQADSELAHTLEAYEALLCAMGCETKEGNVTYSKAMDLVEKYKNCLDQQGLAAYRKLTNSETTEG